jgi:predicted nucleic acid-binding protein
MVAFDASVLIDLFNPNLGGTRKARVDLLLQDLVARRQKVMVPAPAYSEFLVGAASARDAYLKRIAESSVFRVGSFDQAAAIECALLLKKVFTAKEQRNIAKAKIKFDWMIVSIVKTTPEITHIYSGDADIVRCAKHVGIVAVHLDELPLPVQTDWVAETATPKPPAGPHNPD